MVIFFRSILTWSVNKQRMGTFPRDYLPAIKKMEWKVGGIVAFVLLFHIRIFKATSASFVIFDGALKGGEQFLVNVVEDGLVIRLHADLIEVSTKYSCQNVLIKETLLRNLSKPCWVATHSRQPTPKDINWMCILSNIQSAVKTRQRKIDR